MRLKDGGTAFTVWASVRDTESWATRPGAAWPCSTLRGRRFCATFDRSGLVELTVDGRHASDDVDGHEFNACVADLVAESLRIPEDHPCWFVAVGQFRSGRRERRPIDRTRHGYPVQCPLCGATVTDQECDHCGADA